MEFNDKLFFSSIFDFGFNPLVSTDGTEVGTDFIAQEFRFIYGPIGKMNDTLIFCSENSSHRNVGNEIYFYTLDGNIRVFDINQGSGNFGNSKLYQTIATPDNVFFTIDDGSGFIHPYVYKRNDLTNGTKNKPNEQSLILFPNPVKEILYFDQKIELREISKISLITENGIEIKVDSWNGNKINTKILLPGFYKILIYAKSQLKYSGSFTKTE